MDQPPHKERDWYMSLRRQYQPQTTKLAIVAESPPASGRYFYDETGGTKEPLFGAVMRQLGLQPAAKPEGLRTIQQMGWVLVDATYERVNKLNASSRNEIISKDYPKLIEDLRTLKPEFVVLIKANVCRLLEARLTADGFRVLNAGRPIYFPSHGRQNDFRRQFDEIVLAAVAR